MGLVNKDAAYATEYGELFPQPFLPGIYASDIDTTKYASLANRKKEAVHKANIADWEIYDVGKSEAYRLSPTSLRMSGSLHFRRGGPALYVKRKTKELMDQLRVVCTGHHAIDLLEFQDEMRAMRVTTDMIPQYIAALEKAQLQAARAGMPSPDNYLMMVATKAMLLSERFPWANEDWEDIKKFSKL